MRSTSNLAKTPRAKMLEREKKGEERRKGRIYRGSGGWNEKHIHLTTTAPGDRKQKQANGPFLLSSFRSRTTTELPTSASSKIPIAALCAMT